MLSWLSSLNPLSANSAGQVDPRSSNLRCLLLIYYTGATVKISDSLLNLGPQGNERVILRSIYLFSLGGGRNRGGSREARVVVHGAVLSHTRLWRGFSLGIGRCRAVGRTGSR